MAHLRSRPLQPPLQLVRPSLPTALSYILPSQTSEKHSWSNADQLLLGLFLVKSSWEIMVKFWPLATRSCEIVPSNSSTRACPRPPVESSTYFTSVKSPPAQYRQSLPTQMLVKSSSNKRWSNPRQTPSLNPQHVDILPVQEHPTPSTSNPTLSAPRPLVKSSSDSPSLKCRPNLTQDLALRRGK